MPDEFTESDFTPPKDEFTESDFAPKVDFSKSLAQPGQLTAEGTNPYAGSLSAGPFSPYQPENMQEAVDIYKSLLEPPFEPPHFTGTSPLGKIGAGVGNVASSLYGALASPAGLLTLPVAAESAPVRAAMAGLAAQQAGQSLNKVLSGQGGIQEATEGLLTGALAAGMTPRFGRPSIPEFQGPVSEGSLLRQPTGARPIELPREVPPVVPPEAVAPPPPEPVAPIVPEPEVTPVVAEKPPEPTPPTPEPVQEATPPTPEPAVAKVATEVQKVARTEGQRSAKEVKAELVKRIEGEIDSIIDNQDWKTSQNPEYPNRWQLTSKSGDSIAVDVEKKDNVFSGTVFGVAGGKRTVTGKTIEDVLYDAKAHASSEGGTVKISIPGDGDFTVFRNGTALVELRDRASRIKTSTQSVKTLYSTDKTTVGQDADAAAKAYGSPESAYRSVRRQLKALQDQEPPRDSTGRKEWNSQIQGASALIDELYHRTEAGKLDAQSEAAKERVGTYKVGAEGFENEIARLEKIKRKTAAHKERLEDLKERYKQNQEFIKTNESNAALWEQQAAKQKASLESEPTPPIIVGMGGAVPSEFELSAKTPTGIRNAQVDAERAQRGLPPAIQPAKRSFGEVWDRAMAIVDQDPAYQDNLLAELEKKPRALTDTEDALVLQRQIDLQNEYGKATRDLAQAFEDGRTDAVEENKFRVAGLSDQLLKLYNIGKRVGTETGRGLNARRMMAYEDFSLAKMGLEMRAAKGGAPLTPEETNEITRLNQRILETQKAYDDYRAQTDTRLAESESRRVLAELQAKTAPAFDKRILAQAESIVSRFETAAKPAADRLRERLSRMSAGVDPTILTDAAIVGSAKIARLGLDLAKFTDEMVRDFGEKIRPMIGDIWAEANKMIDAVTAKAPEPVKRAVKKALTTSQIKDATVEAVKDKVAKGKMDEITWQVQYLARALVQSGITEREPLIDAVHDVLKEAIPEITRRETMDAISGYGDYKQLSKDAITVQLRGMKGEMQQIAKLEDMAAGEPPLKSGVERRTPTEAERQLVKLVNDAKVKFQVPVSDPNTQLKSALDTLKTTLRNRIADYEERIAKGDYAARPRREVVLDPEASRLKAENERVKKQFQRGVALERLKNMGTVERGANWVTKWRRGFLLSGPVTLAKLTAAAVQRMVITPTEEAVGAGIGKIIPQVAEKAAREGTFNSTAEAKALTQSITQGMKDAWQTLRTGQSDLDVLYGKEALLPPSAVDFFGHVHGALKAPTKRAEFARSLEKRTQNAISNGVDVSDPMVQSRLVIESYKDANKSIFLQDNRVVDAYKRMLSGLEQKNKITGEVPLGGKLAATAARVLLPIVKVPTNIVAETLQYATGSVTGSVRLAAAFRNGIENLKPEEADLIMRELKKGSIGAAVMLLGYFNPQVIGGYYQQGEKRKKGEAKVGSIQLYGSNIPSFLLHNPLLETLQIGATIRRVADSKVKKGDKDTQGVGAGIYAGATGLASEVPFVREMWEVSKAFNPREKGAFWGELGKSLIVPQLLQSLANKDDENAQGVTRKRAPKTVIQHIETGIPVLRHNVPLAKKQPVQ